MSDNRVNAYQEPWKKLIVRYLPDDKRVCNCEMAYYTLIKNHPRAPGREWWGCQNGCEWNKSDAGYHIAAKAVEELGLHESENPNG